MPALNALVTEAVDLVVHCARIGGRPQVTEIIAVEDQQTGPDSTAFTVTQVFDRERPDAPLTPTGQRPVRCAGALAAVGADLGELLDPAVAPRTGAAEVPR